MTIIHPLCNQRSLSLDQRGAVETKSSTHRDRLGLPPEISHLPGTIVRTSFVESIAFVHVGDNALRALHARGVSLSSNRRGQRERPNSTLALTDDVGPLLPMGTICCIVIPCPNTASGNLCQTDYLGTQWSGRFEIVIILE